MRMYCVVFQMQLIKENRTRFGKCAVFVVLVSTATVCGKTCLAGCHCFGEECTVADCSGKNLKKVPENVNSSLHYIDLSNNRITEIRLDDLRGYASIRIINLSNNGINKIYEDSFHELVNLTHLYLSENNISYLPPATFNHNVNLKKLYLKRNPLTIPKRTSLLASDSITYLDIAFCNITHLPAEIFVSLPHLVALRLDGNILTNIPTGTFEALKSLEEIYMESETVKCAEPSHREFIIYLQKRGIKYYGPAICCKECSNTMSLALEVTVHFANSTVSNQAHRVVTSAMENTISATETTVPSLKRTTFICDDARHGVEMSSLTHNPVLQNFSQLTEGLEESSSKSLPGSYSPSLTTSTINLLSTCFGVLYVL